MHVPQYVLAAGDNNVVGLNSVGLKRDQSLAYEDRRQIKEAFTITYRSGKEMVQIIESLDACKDFGPAAVEFRKFVNMVPSRKNLLSGPLFQAKQNIDQKEVVLFIPLWKSHENYGIIFALVFMK